MPWWRRAISLLDLLGERGRGDDAGAVAGVDAGLLDVLHDGADDGGLAVGDAIDIDLGGVLEETVDEDGALRAGLDGVAHVVAQLVVVVDDLHGASAEDEAGADEDGIADALRRRRRLRLRWWRCRWGLVEAELVEHGGEKLAVFGELDASAARCR